MTKHIAIYCRVSSTQQSHASQLPEANKNSPIERVITFEEFRESLLTFDDLARGHTFFLNEGDEDIQCLLSLGASQ